MLSPSAATSTCWWRAWTSALSRAANESWPLASMLPAVIHSILGRRRRGNQPKDQQRLLKGLRPSENPKLRVTELQTLAEAAPRATRVLRQAQDEREGVTTVRGGPVGTMSAPQVGACSGLGFLARQVPAPSLQGNDCCLLVPFVSSSLNGCEFHSVHPELVEERVHLHRRFLRT
jgi:hypothetical protein